MRARTLCLALVAGALVLVLALALVGGVAPASRPAGSAPDAAKACADAAGRTMRVSVAVEGQGTRSALVHLPRGRRGRLPLILALHGAYGSGAFMERYSGLSRLADRAGAGVVYPDAAGPRWRATTARCRRAKRAGRSRFSRSTAQQTESSRTTARRRTRRAMSSAG